PGTACDPAPADECVYTNPHVGLRVETRCACALGSAGAADDPPPSQLQWRCRTVPAYSFGPVPPPDLVGRPRVPASGSATHDVCAAVLAGGPCAPRRRRRPAAGGTPPPTAPMSIPGPSAGSPASITGEPARGA